MKHNGAAAAVKPADGAAAAEDKADGAAAAEEKADRAAAAEEPVDSAAAAVEPADSAAAAEEPADGAKSKYGPLISIHNFGKGFADMQSDADAARKSLEDKLVTIDDYPKKSMFAWVNPKIKVCDANPLDVESFAFCAGSMGGERKQQNST